MSYSNRVKNLAYRMDPGAFKSYSGAIKSVKQHLDVRRTRALQDAARHFNEPIDGAEPSEPEGDGDMIDIDKKYQTRDGRKVRLISNNGSTEYPIIGLLENSMVVECWTAEGRIFSGSSMNRNKDLLPVLEKIKVAVWATPNGVVHVTKIGRNADTAFSDAVIIDLEVPQS